MCLIVIMKHSLRIVLVIVIIIIIIVRVIVAVLIVFIEVPKAATRGGMRGSRRTIKMFEKNVVGFAQALELSSRLFVPGVLIRVRLQCRLDTVVISSIVRHNQWS